MSSSLSSQDGSSGANNKSPRDSSSSTNFHRNRLKTASTDSLGSAENSEKNKKCCQNVTTWLEKVGLLFGDSTLEWEFLVTTRYSTLACAFGFFIFLFASGFYVWALVVQEDHLCAKISAGAMGASTFTSAILLLVAALSGSKPRRVVTFTQLAAGAFVVCLAAYVPFSRCRAEDAAGLLNPSFDRFIQDLTQNSSQNCHNATLFPNLTAICADSSAPNGGTCTPYAWLTLYARWFGYYHGSFISDVMGAFVAFQMVVIINALPAKILIFGIPLGTLVLLFLVWQLMQGSSVGNLKSSMEVAMGCSLHIVATLMAVLFELFIALTAASAALLFQAVSRSRLKRELFFWTKALNVRDVVMLRNFLTYVWLGVVVVQSCVEQKLQCYVLSYCLFKSFEPPFFFHLRLYPHCRPLHISALTTTTGLYEC